MPHELVFIEAAAGSDGTAPGPPRVQGTAYSGGPVHLPFWRHPVVVDMAGMELPETVPLLSNHENRTQARVGVVRARVLNGALEIEGEVVADHDTARDIVAQGRKADWQLSIGAEPREVELVGEGRSREVNGQQHAGPFFHVKKSALREVSVVAVGADAHTHLKIAAQFNLGRPPMPKDLDPKFVAWCREAGIEAEGLPDTMLAKLTLAFEAETKPPAAPEKPGKTEPAKPAAPISAAAPEPKEPEKPAEKTPPATTVPTVAAAAPAPSEADIQLAAANAVARERERIAGVQAVCNGEFPDIEREAIAANWTPEAAGQEVLKRIRASRPVLDAAVTTWSAASKPDTVKTLEAALCLRAGLDAEDLVKQYGDKVVEAAHRDRLMSLQELFGRCLRMEGKYFTSFDNDAIRAAFSSVSLPGILSGVANKKLLDAYKAQPLVATKVCREGDLANFNEANRYRLTDVGDLEKVNPTGEIKHGGLKEEGAKNKLDTYGKSFTLNRQMIINDDLGSFLAIPAALGARAARKIDQLFFQRLMANPGNLFSAAHNNFASGADTALSAEALARAVQMFLDQTDADGQPINLAPKYLLVPTALKMAAKELLNSVTFMATGTDNKRRIPTYNALADEDLTVLSASYLANKNYPGASDKGWYLFGDPRVTDTFEIGYLKGQRTPTVEKTATDFDELGIRFRVYFDLGVREQDWRGMVRFAGQ